MGQSLSKIYVHIIFHTKNSVGIIRKNEMNSLFAYVGSIIKDNGSIPIIINGVENHIHILCVMSKNSTLAKLVEEIKRHSSRWIKTLDNHYKDFKWQGGYAGFSVSPSVVEKTKKYIQKQEEHHRKKKYNEEVLLFLNEYKIEYDEKYLWND